MILLDPNSSLIELEFFKVSSSGIRSLRNLNRKELDRKFISKGIAYKILSNEELWFVPFSLKSKNIISSDEIETFITSLLKTDFDLKKHKLIPKNFHDPTFWKQIISPILNRVLREALYEHMCSLETRNEDENGGIEKFYFGSKRYANYIRLFILDMEDSLYFPTNQEKTKAVVFGGFLKLMKIHPNYPFAVLIKPSYEYLEGIQGIRLQPISNNRERSKKIQFIRMSLIQDSHLRLQKFSELIKGLEFMLSNQLIKLNQIAIYPSDLVKKNEG